MNPETAQKILEQTKNGYNKIAEHFSATRDSSWRSPGQFFSYLKMGDKILDIGCGNGRLYEDLKEIGVNYLGVDNSAKFIEIAQGKYGKDKFFIADILNLPFEKGLFNDIFLKAVLPHIPSRELQIKALKNIYRVLKPGGYLFITCWNLWQPKMIWQNLKNRIKNKKNYNGLSWQYFLIPWKSSSGEILSQRFYHAFTKKELKKLLEKAGFKIGKIFYEYKGEKSNWLKGFNLVAVAKKWKI